MRRRLLAVMALGLALACGSPVPGPHHGDDAGAADAGNAADAGSAGNVADAGSAADAGAPDAGTRLLATLGGRSGPFDRAQHGLEPDGGLYVEAHFGGDPACPTASSPTPDRTLVISGLPVLPGGATFGTADGLRVTLLDFSGALTQAPVVRAVAARASAFSGVGGGQVAFTLEVTFDGGLLSGQVSAPHCASLDGP